MDADPRPPVELDAEVEDDATTPLVIVTTDVSVVVGDFEVEITIMLVTFVTDGTVDNDDDDDDDDDDDVVVVTDVLDRDVVEVVDVLLVEEKVLVE